MDGLIRSWSRGAELLFGYVDSEVVGKSLTLLHVDEDAAPLLREAAATGRFKTTGWRRHKCGRRVWVEASLHLRRNSVGQALGFIKTVRDESAHFETTERLRALVNSTAYAVIAAGVEGVITVFNQAAERLLGYTSFEVVGKMTPAPFHDFDEVVKRARDLSLELGCLIEPGFETFVAWTRETGLPDERLWTYITRDGYRVPVLLSVTALRDPYGQVTGYLGLAKDMSEINTARRELAEQEERSRAIFEASIDATFVIDDRGTIVDLNPAVVRIFGFERHELIGRNISIIMPPETAVHHDEYLSAYRRTGQRRAIGLIREVEAQRKDGSCFPVELSISEATIAGRRVFVGTLRDCSARRAVEHERDRFKRILEATTDFVGMADPEGNLIFQNSAGNALIGWDREADLTGKRIPHVHPPAVAKWVVDNALPVAMRDGSCEYESALMHKDGTEIPVSQVLMVHRNRRGEVEYLSTIMRDLRSQRRAEALLAKVAAQVQGMLYQLALTANGELRFPYASAGAYELYEVSPQELASSSQLLQGNLPEEDQESFVRSIHESARDLTPWVAEYRYRRRDGSVRWHRAQSKPERQPDGSTLWHGFVTDVTELRAAADEVRRSKAELERAIAALDAGFAMFDSEERLIVCNDRYAQEYGIDAEHRTARPKYEALIRTRFCNDQKFLVSLHGTSFEAWLANRLHEFRNSATCVEQRMGDKWIRLDDRHTADGGVVSTHTDITSLKDSEFQARIQKQRLSLATSSAGVGIWELNLASNALEWDARMHEMYGYDGTNFPGTFSGWLDRLHPDDAAPTQAMFQASIAASKDFKARFRVALPSGNVRHIEARSTYVRDHDGNIVKVLGINLDITDHVETEQQLRLAANSALSATKAKAEFLATMSHEIRTPMNGVIGMTNLLMGTQLQADQREYVETIRSSGESLLSLLNDILDFSKMEAGKLVLERVPFSLEQTVVECLNLFTTQAESKGVALQHEFSSAPLEVLGDPTRVRQILLNLVSNALKFTNQGYVRASVSVERRADSTVMTTLRIDDTGIGMSKEHLARLGEAFVQADASTTRKFGGTGLGISICITLVDLMNGRLSVTSELGRGTTFEVQLPFELAPTKRVVQPAPQQSREPRRLLRRVLVAEDNAVNQRIMSLMLKNLAQEVIIAEDGREALDRFRCSEFDCVFMDGQMPNMDGLVATQHIRAYERESGRRRTPIIALTANALPSDRETFLNAGMDDYLTKPVRQNDLIAALSRAAAEEL